MSSDLPAGWARATVADLIGSGGTFCDGDWVESKDQDRDGDVRLTQLADIGEGVWRDRSNRFMTSSKAAELRCTFLEAGDVLVARMPEPLGRACRFPGHPTPCVTVVDVAVLRPGSGSVDASWLMHALNSPQVRSAVVALQAGTTRKRISRKNLAGIELLLPPRAEQARIVDEVERRLSHINAAAAGLARSMRQLRTARRAVLRSAATGQLVACNSSDDLRRMCDRLRVPYSVENVPPGWVTVELGNIATIGSGSTPRRGEDRFWQDGDIPWVTSGQVTLGMIRKPAALITRAALKETSVKLWPRGTLLMAMYGEGDTRGHVAELDIDATCNQACAAIRLREEFEFAKQFVLVALQARYEKNRKLGGGGVQENLNLGLIRGLRLDLPSFDVQLLLVSEAERRLSLIDAARRTIDDGLARVGQLRRSVLAGAFSGRLVRQDPEEEAAHVLLDHVRSEQACAGAKAPARRKEKEVTA